MDRICRSTGGDHLLTSLTVSSHAEYRMPALRESIQPFPTCSLLLDRYGKIRADIETAQATHTLICMDRYCRLITTRIKICRLFEDVKTAHLSAVTTVFADEAVDDNVEAAEITGEASCRLRHGGLFPVGPLHRIKGGTSPFQTNCPDSRPGFTAWCGFRRFRFPFSRQRFREVSRSA